MGPPCKTLNHKCAIFPGKSGQNSSVPGQFSALVKVFAVIPPLITPFDDIKNVINFLIENILQLFSLVLKILKYSENNFKLKLKCLKNFKCF